MDTASKGLMEDEFGTSKDDDVVKQILERGSIVESEVALFSGCTCCGKELIDTFADPWPHWRQEYHQGPCCVSLKDSIAWEMVSEWRKRGIARA